jgi:hypothetical protein
VLRRLDKVVGRLAEASAARIPLFSWVSYTPASAQLIEATETTGAMPGMRISLLTAALVLGGSLAFAQPSPFYEFETVADARSLGLTWIDSAAINDRGVVAFRGRYEREGREYDGLYLYDPATRSTTPLVNAGLSLPNSGDAPTQQFSSWLHLTNADEVIVQRRLDARVLAPCIVLGGVQSVAPLTYLEAWSTGGAGLPRAIVMGDAGLRRALGCVLNPFGSPFAYLDPAPPFDALMPFTAGTSLGQYVFGALKRLGQPNLRVTGPHPGPFPWLGGDTPGLQIRPSMAETGHFVFSTGTTNGRIFLESFDFSQLREIAGPPHFSAVGQHPTISSDAGVVAFYGELTPSGAAALDLPPGRGLFVYIRTDDAGGGRLVRADMQLSRATAGSNVCQYVASIEARCTSLGTLPDGAPITLTFSDADFVSRLGAVLQPEPQGGTVLISFTAMPSGGALPHTPFVGGRKTLWTVRLDARVRRPAPVELDIRVRAPIPVVQVDGISVDDFSVGVPLASLTELDSATPLAARPAETAARRATSRSAHNLTIAIKQPFFFGFFQWTVVKARFEDSDDDAIPDGWEQTDSHGQPRLNSGVDFLGNGSIDLVLTGSRVGVKDVYLELDYIDQGQPCCQPPVGALEDVIRAFEAAPVEVALHASATGDKIPFHQPTLAWDQVPGAFNDFQDLKTGGEVPQFCGGTGPGFGYFGTESDRSATNCLEILAAKRLVMHYGIVGPRFSHDGEPTDSSGVADVVGDDLFVRHPHNASPGFAAECRPPESIENCSRRRRLAGTLMHELGHNLGLDHGGAPHDIGDRAAKINYKPNYLSVMNYSLQWPGNAPLRPLDYSRQRLATLDEKHLDEPLECRTV